MNIIKKYLDYERRKELDKQARDMWTDLVSTGRYKGEDVTETMAYANTALAAYYDAFYPRIKS